MLAAVSASKSSDNELKDVMVWDLESGAIKQQFVGTHSL
jgi:hypothetical protein